MGDDEFGKLLTQGLKSIAVLEKTDLTDLQQEIGKEIGVSVWTIYKWRRGVTIPGDARTIRLLARAGVRRGRMDRQWLVDFLKRTAYEDKLALIHELYPEDTAVPAVTHNLPRRQHKKLIGRDRELDDLKSFLSPQHRMGVVCISGGGGVGKTALALEIAHSCCENHAHLPADERFDTIIWVTAKNLELLPAGTAERQPTFTDLDGVYRAIGELLNVPAIFRAATRAEQNIVVTRLLTENRVLLMLDNLENVDDQELMVFLRDLPAPSKAIVTTRHRIDVAVPVHLHSLEESNAHELVYLECERHNLSISGAQIKLLLRRTGGLPLAIVRTIGRMAWRGSNIETELQQLADPANETYDFCFGKTIALIKPGDAYQLFMTLALFADSASREALGFGAGFGENVLNRDEGLSDLEVLSLCSKDKDRFSLEPMTRTQALSELRADPDFERNARERWVAWYLDFTAKHGGIDWQEWHLRYDILEGDWENVLAVLQWCIEQGHYGDVVALWQNVRDFTHIYGYWGDRLNLLGWIIAEAERRDEWQTAIRVMYDKAFTLTLTGPPTRLEEADALLQRCWSLRDCADDVIRSRIASLTASLRIRQGQYAEAHRLLDTAEQLLLDAGLDDITLARELTGMLHDRGENWLVMGHYDNAETVFRRMLEQAQSSGWQRGLIHAQNWLAYTGILQGDLALAEKMLQMGWPAAKRNKEKRIIALYKRSFAYFHQAQGNSSEAITWAKAALDYLERLGMNPEVQEVRALVKKLETGEVVAEST